MKLAEVALWALLVLLSPVIAVVLAVWWLADLVDRR